MATVQDRLYAQLAASTGLTGLVSTRIYPTKLPQGVDLPAVTYFRVSGVREHAMASDPNVVHSLFQVSSWDDDPAGTRAVAAQVALALSRWSNTTGSPDILEIFIENEIDLWELTDDDDVGVYHTAQDFMVHHRE